MLPTWNMRYAQLRKAYAAAIKNWATATTSAEKNFFRNRVDEIQAQMFEEAPIGLLV